MLFKAFFYLFGVLCLKNTSCIKNRLDKTAEKGIAITGNHNEIRIGDSREEINRLKDHVKMLQKSSEKTLAQVNRLMMTSILFPRNGTNNYVLLRNVITKDLVSVTVCFWMKTADTTNSGTPFSYNKGTSDNELLIFNYKKFEFWIHGERRQASFSANDGSWHHICGTWQSTDGSWALYKDGTVKAQGKGFKTGSKIRGGGVLVLGQEQDQEGGKFEAYQAFVGRMTSVDVWSRVLPSQEILRMSGSCGLGYCDVMRWSDVRGRNRHNVGLEYLPKCT